MAEWSDDEQGIERRLKRVERWALQWSKEELAQAIAHLTVIHMALKAAHRATEGQAEAAIEAAYAGADATRAIEGRYRLAADAANRLARESVMQKYRRTKAAEKRWEKDPARLDKPKAHRMWLDWQSGKKLHKSAAAFYRYVVDNTQIANERTVERYAKAWKAERPK